jgi:zinc transporter, ZIP family
MVDILDYLSRMNPATQALAAGTFTWALTAIGAAVVFATKEVSKKLLDFMLGLAAGVMIAASYWSLLAPAIELSQGHMIASWFPAAAGFLFGFIVLRSIDAVLPHLHIGFPINEAEGIRTSWNRSVLLVLAITLHNIPEGLAIGVAFGSVGAGASFTTLPAAVALAVGIGIQNLPEGLAISAPLRGEGMSRLKSFWYGQLSAVVEPVAAVIGAMVVVMARPLLPYALAFAAGAMIFVVVEEVIPESQREGNTHLATGGTMLGFLIMMILDVSFA